MQIHELNTRTPGVYDYAALDTGSQTYKAQVGSLKPQYTSYDSANPTSWADVATMGSNTPISTFFERVTYIARNVRYLWKLIGSNAFSNVAETISGAIGNTALPTTATSLSGAIAEHEEDISQINGNLTNINYRKRKTGNSMTAEFVTTGVQIDANRVFAMITLPFITTNNDYTVTVNSCTLLGISVITPSTVTIDNKTTAGFRLSIPYSGTVRSAYAVVLALTITY